jgi:hypothetical protein
MSSIITRQERGFNQDIFQPRAASFPGVGGRQKVSRNLICVLSLRIQDTRAIKGILFSFGNNILQFPPPHLAFTIEENMASRTNKLIW